jgi:DNA-binding Lrp family transcriptional regulator
MSPQQYWALDKLDISIIRELSQERTMPARVGLRSSYRDMSRKLRVSPGTIRNRIGAMYKSGILKGTSVYVNPSLVGLKGAAYAMDVSQDIPKRDIIAKLKSIDGVLFIHNFISAFVGIYFLYGTEEPFHDTLDQLRHVAGAKDEGILSLITYPPCLTPTMTDAEWRLISRLSQKSFDSYSGLAHELQISVRTLKRQFSKLLSANAILSSPTLDYRAITGGIPADLIAVFGNPSEKIEAEKTIIDLVGEYLIFAGIGEKFTVYNLVLPKVGIASDLASSAMRIEGVESARIELVDEHIDLTSRLGIYVKKRSNLAQYS